MLNNLPVVFSIPYNNFVTLLFYCVNRSIFCLTDLSKNSVITYTILQQCEYPSLCMSFILSFAHTHMSVISCLEAILITLTTITVLIDDQVICYNVTVISSCLYSVQFMICTYDKHVPSASNLSSKLSSNWYFE